MTPPCPNCGCIYSEGPADNAGWRSVSIASSSIFQSLPDGTIFHGEEYYCQRCNHRWRVPYRRGIEDDLRTEEY